jgi:superfamily II DNA/RNA helicase
MYSPYLAEYVQELATYAGTRFEDVGLLRDIMSCFVQTLGQALDCEVHPPADFLTTSVRLLLLSDGLSSQAVNKHLPHAHYLVGLGFEQIGELRARLQDQDSLNSPLLENDSWYCLSLAFLHYLAGGYRVQALCVLRHLEHLAVISSAPIDYSPNYQLSVNAFRRLYSGAVVQVNPENIWGHALDDITPVGSAQTVKINLLFQRIQEQRASALRDLGLDQETQWLRRRGLDRPNVVEFWRKYLRSLDARNMTSFTREQIGLGFDDWLKPNKSLLVVLPTGSGKTVIGELMTALTLAQGKQVLWLLPTRALVRQVRRDLRDAFSELGIVVEELPTTEDFTPLFSELPSTARYIATSTPEKLLALLRTNPQATSQVGLVVLDEAQILRQPGSRSTTAEAVITDIRQRQPNCAFVFMTAAKDELEPLRKFALHLGISTISEITSDVRPTRQIFGVLTRQPASQNESIDHAVMLLYPPGRQNEYDTTDNPYELVINKHKPLATRSDLKIVEPLMKAMSSSSIRSVIFVGHKGTTEKLAREMARYCKAKTELPKNDLARLQVELGRDSIVQTTGFDRIAPHHGGLSPVEQFTVEKWMRQGIIQIVVATPTLAQGVNLPFDVSVVTFTSRTSPNGSREDLYPSEIQNMLGRAGRAGYVADGICLVTQDPAANTRPERVLDHARRFFFGQDDDKDEALGLAHLVQLALKANVGEPNWIFELSRTRFTEAQGLVHFALDVTNEVPTESLLAAIQAFLKKYPSTASLPDAAIRQSATALAGLVSNVRSYCGENRTLLQAIRKTGLPIALLERLLFALQENTLCAYNR